MLRSLGVCCCLCRSVSLHVDVEKIYGISLSRACLLAVTTGVLSARRDRDRFVARAGVASVLWHKRQKALACVCTFRTINVAGELRFTGESLYIMTLENFTRANARDTTRHAAIELFTRGSKS